MPARREALLVHVTGVVQGVGFRPFVHRLATCYELAGWVRNDSGDVSIAVEGSPASLDAFLCALRNDAPTLARVERVIAESRGATGAAGFQILQSELADDRPPPVPADVAVCAACERELRDPTNRRYDYPFITCTDCGPRYTVIESMPYDRERTMMRSFVQCPTCRHEYETPGDRRHHSETNSCPDCGPRLWIRFPGEPNAANESSGSTTGEALAAAASFLRRGLIVALRGVGGFHLAVDATNNGAVERLRVRKHRDAKPLAIMVRTVDEARVVAHVDTAQAGALLARERPIVLLRRRSHADRGPIAPAVAPGLDTIGVMLAYTPLHELLLDRVGRPLVMTSGNRSEEPIAASVSDAMQRLGEIADVFLLHDREIVSPIDDSVVRVAGDQRILIRRARGHAPVPLGLPSPASTPIVAVGALLKSTFTLAQGERAFVSPHLGDLDSLETLTHFQATLARYEELFRVRPEVVARDLHPDYMSTRIADELAGGSARVITVQHHHAHIAAVLGEHGCDERVIGVAYDGTGYGTDATVWGGELLLADCARFERVGHLRPAPLPGGDLAARSPWRSALGYLSLQPELAPRFARAFDGVDAKVLDVARQQVARGLNAPLASSMGRLFDAAAAVLGVCHESRFEGEAAMRLESIAGARCEPALPFPIIDAGGVLQLDPIPLLEALASRRAAGHELSALAAAFHTSVAEGTASIVRRLCENAHLRTVALGGGVFQNARLTTTLRSALESRRLRVLLPIDLPPNDGAISYGQAVVAATLLGGCDLETSEVAFGARSDPESHGA